jgi:hypothetical protein
MLVSIGCSMALSVAARNRPRRLSISAVAQIAVQIGRQQQIQGICGWVHEW